MGGVKKIDSEPDPKTKTPDPVSLQILDSKSSSESGCVTISAMFLHTFYIHYTIHIPNPDPAFSQIFKSRSGSGSEKCSLTPDPLRSGSGSVPISVVPYIIIF